MRARLLTITALLCLLLAQSWAAPSAASDGLGLLSSAVAEHDSAHSCCDDNNPELSCEAHCLGAGSGLLPHNTLFGPLLCRAANAPATPLVQPCSLPNPVYRPPIV